MSSSPRGWLNFAVSVLDRYGRPHSPRYEYEGFSYRRVSDRRETAIDITNALDRATHGNGAGKLLLDYYVNEVNWYAFTDNERWIMERAIRRFRRELQAAGFLPDPKDGEEGDH
jgi:hypothetical protein